MTSAAEVVDSPRVGSAPALVRMGEWLENAMSDEPEQGWARRFQRLMPWLVILSVLAAALRARFSGKTWMVFFEDDFFYYLKIGQNLAHGKGSTFNGIVQTNGYHPLWQLVVAAISVFTTNGWTIFWTVVTLALIASVAVFFLSRKVLEQAQLSPLVRSALAAYLAIYSLHLFYTGMEIILAIPMMFLFIVVAANREWWQRGLWQSVGLGLLISIMVLSRLDLILFAGLVGIFALVNREVRQSITRAQVFGLALGMLPLVFYFGMNHIVFHTWFPVSGMAKQLKFTLAPSWRPWDSFYQRNVNNWTNLAVVHFGLLSLPFVWKRLNSTQKVLFPAVLAFPFLYVALLCCVSDWQIWLWYLYPVRAAMCVSFIVYSMLPLTRKYVRSRAFAVALVAVIFAEVAVSKWWTDVQEPIYYAAVDIAKFAETHPGIYAMGDRSGMVAYLMPDPVIQTEGLVMDRNFLEKMRRQEPLIPVLKEYHVRYYVGTKWDPYQGCFHAEEPFQAGVTSAHMVGDFCQPPSLRTQHEYFRTRIFDLGQ